MPIRSTVEKITPEVAAKILEDSKTIQNRNVSDHHVEWLTSQMRDGRWVLNGEAIIVDEDGQLLDGQHRLWAVVNSGITIESLVTRGVERKAFPTIDTGAARTSSNTLTMTGEKNTKVLAAALGLLHRYDQGKMLWSLKPSGFSPAVGLALLKQHPEMRDAVEWACAQGSNPILRKVSKSPLAFLRYLIVGHKPQKGKEFFDLVGDAIPDVVGSPTRVLRNWYLTKESVKGHSSTLELMAVTVKAWTAFLDGSKPQKLLWRRAGQFPESFPNFPGEKESRGKALKMVKRTS